MAKNKNVETPAPITSADVADKSAYALDTTEFRTVELTRKWYRAVPGGAPLVGVILGRSGDVSDVYKGMNDDGEPKFVYAVELRRPIPKESGSVVQGGEEIGADILDIVYMFEPRALAGFLATAHQTGAAFCIHALEKRAVPSRKLGRTVQSWQWAAKILPRPVAAFHDSSAILLPAGGGDADVTRAALTATADAAQ